MLFSMTDPVAPVLRSIKPSGGVLPVIVFEVITVFTEPTTLTPNESEPISFVLMTSSELPAVIRTPPALPIMTLWVTTTSEEVPVTSTPAEGPMVKTLSTVTCEEEETTMPLISKR